jgi:hypothetical protein
VGLPQADGTKSRNPRKTIQHNHNKIAINNRTMLSHLNISKPIQRYKISDFEIQNILRIKNGSKSTKEDMEAVKLNQKRNMLKGGFQNSSIPKW